MRILTNILVKCVPNTRNIYHNTRTPKTVPQVSWRNLEVLQSIEAELSQPPRQIIPQTPPKRLSDSNPANQTYQDVGKYYTIPPSDIQRYFMLGGFPTHFVEMCAAFTETCLMVRKPVLEIIDYMKQANYNKLPVKYLLYGPIKSGKSLSLAHIMHYAGQQDFILFHVPYAPNLHDERRRETHWSEKKPGLVDTPLEGSYLLKHFQLQNIALMEKLQLKLSKDHAWNARETITAGTSLIELVNHGINRVNYACESIDILIEELKKHATAGRCKVLFAMDGFNGLFSEHSTINIEDKFKSVLDMSIIQSCFSFLKPDWCNGAAVLTASERVLPKWERGESMPFTLLRRKGFELIDPFIPVEIPALTEYEFNCLLDYYEDRRWLQKPGGREELEFLTTRIIGEIAKLCAPL